MVRVSRWHCLSFGKLFGLLSRARPTETVNGEIQLTGVHCSHIAARRASALRAVRGRQPRGAEQSGAVRDRTMQMRISRHNKNVGNVHFPYVKRFRF